MASLQAHLLVAFLKWTVKRKLRRGRSLEAARDALGANVPRVSRSVIASEETIGGVKGEWSRPRAGGLAGTLLYLHGGGYVVCSPQTHRPLTNGFAKAGFEVFAPDYRLAPEFPFPAAIDDAVSVYRALIARGTDPATLAVAGDSAGGGLTLALLLQLRELGLPMPAAAMLFSPWTDLAITGASGETNARSCAMFDGDLLRGGVEIYLAGADPRDPLASPLYADLHGLPPMRIHASSSESLRDDSTRLAERARAAGVPCGIRLWPVVPHVWQLFKVLPEARESMTIAVDFLKDATASSRPAAENRVRLVK